jgi:hypothetical protein
VAHASWSLKDPKVILLDCQLSKGKFGLLVVGMDGRRSAGWMPEKGDR